MPQQDTPLAQAQAENTNVCPITQNVVDQTYRFSLEKQCYDIRALHEWIVTWTTSEPKVPHTNLPIKKPDLKRIIATYLQLNAPKPLDPQPANPDPSIHHNLKEKWYNVEDLYKWQHEWYDKHHTALNKNPIVPHLLLHTKSKEVEIGKEDRTRIARKYLQLKYAPKSIVVFANTPNYAHNYHELQGKWYNVEDLYKWRREWYKTVRTLLDDKLLLRMKAVVPHTLSDATPTEISKDVSQWITRKYIYITDAPKPLDPQPANPDPSIHHNLKEKWYNVEDLYKWEQEWYEKYGRDKSYSSTYLSDFALVPHLLSQKEPVEISKADRAEISRKIFVVRSPKPISEKPQSDYEYQFYKLDVKTGILEAGWYDVNYMHKTWFRSSWEECEKNLGEDVFQKICDQYYLHKYEKRSIVRNWATLIENQPLREYVADMLEQGLKAVGDKEYENFDGDLFSEGEDEDFDREELKIPGTTTLYALRIETPEIWRIRGQDYYHVTTVFILELIYGGENNCYAELSVDKMIKVDQPPFNDLDLTNHKDVRRIDGEHGFDPNEPLNVFVNVYEQLHDSERFQKTIVKINNKDRKNPLMTGEIDTIISNIRSGGLQKGGGPGRKKGGRLDKRTLDELRKLAKSRKLKGCSKLNKTDLIARLRLK